MKKLFLSVVLLFLIQILNAQDSLHFKQIPYKITIYTSADDGMVKGYMRSFTDTSVYLSKVPIRFNGYASNAPGLAAIHYNNISEVKLRRKGSTGRGILKGAIIGAVTGAILGYADGDDFKKNQGVLCLFCATAGEKAAAGGIVFGLTGGVVGGVIGALARKTFTIEGKKDKFDNLKRKLIH